MICLAPIYHGGGEKASLIIHGPIRPVTLIGINRTGGIFNELITKVSACRRRKKDRKS